VSHATFVGGSLQRDLSPADEGRDAKSEAERTMSEARKLDDYHQEPLLRQEPAVLAPVAASPVDAAASVEAAAVREAPKSRAPSRVQQTLVRGVDSASRTALILFVIGLLAFAAGIALSSAIIMDALDHKSGWVKDVIDAVKSLAKVLKNW